MWCEHSKESALEYTLLFVLTVHLSLCLKQMRIKGPSLTDLLNINFYCTSEGGRSFWWITINTINIEPDSNANYRNTRELAHFCVKTHYKIEFEGYDFWPPKLTVLLTRYAGNWMNDIFWTFSTNKGSFVWWVHVCLLWTTDIYINLKIIYILLQTQLFYIGYKHAHSVDMLLFIPVATMYVYKFCITQEVMGAAQKL